MAFLGSFDTTPQGPGRTITKGLVTGLEGALNNLAKSKLQEIDRERTAKGLQGIGFDEQEAKGISQLNPDIQKEIVKDQFSTGRENRKANQKLVHDIVSAEKGARENLSTLKRIEELDRKGNVQGLTGQLLSKVGLGRYRNADTQELEKLSVGMLRDLKNIFGSRPTNLDVQQYLKSIPTLAQSPEGRARVIKNLKVFNEAAKIRADALREILKENKGRSPGNLELEIENRVGDQLDALNAQISDTGSADNNRFESLPDPAQYAGKTIRDTATGQLLQSNGQQWLPKG